MTKFGTIFANKKFRLAVVGDNKTRDGILFEEGGSSCPLVTTKNMGLIGDISAICTPQSPRDDGTSECRGLEMN